jgi:signal transduction histidine kinase
LIIAIRRASELVEQILTFSGEVKTEEKCVNISRMIKESIKLFKAALPRNIRVESHLSPGSLQVMANPTQIRQIIMNLYTNACRAMQQEGGTLTISTSMVKRTDDAVLNLKSGRYCKISVKDTGHGMNRETQKRVFEPFFSTRPKGEGTGMGLSVVHGIVKTYGGVIEVESFPGKGSRFDVYLPLAQKAGSNKKKDSQ